MPALSKFFQRSVTGGSRKKILKRESTQLGQKNRNIIKVPIAQRTSQSAVLIKESKYAAQRITTGTYTFQVRHNSNTVSMPEVLEHVPVGNAPTETEVKPFEDIPGPPPLSAFGTMIQQLPSGGKRNIDTVERDNKMYEDYGPIVKELIGNTFTVVHLYDPVDIEKIYRSDNKFPMRQAFFMLEMYNKRSNHVQGLLTSHNEHWAHLRKNIQQKMLRPKAVAAYMPDQSIVGDDLLNRIEEMRDENGEVEDLMDTLYKYATECIGVVCFNIRLGALRSHCADSETTKFINAVKTVMDVSHQEFMKFPFYKWFRTPMFNRMAKAQDFIRSMAAKYSDIAVNSKMGDGSEISGEEADLIPYLIAKTALSKSEVHTLISELIFAGVDTTSHYLAFAMYALAQHPEKQAILAAEIDKVIDRSDSITSSQIGHMPYLRAVLKETLRYMPVAPGNCRTTTKDLVCSGYKLPKGTFVGMHNDFVQRQDRHFKEAGQFVPERWLRGEDQEQCHPFATLPFGFGSRSCIGKRFAEQEVSLALIKILKKYRIESDLSSWKLKKSITYTPTEPLKLRFNERA